jgi:hypothetical protein
MYKCRHLKDKIYPKRGRRIAIQGWTAVVCDECYQTAMEVAEEVNILVKQHGTYRGNNN